MSQAQQLSEILQKDVNGYTSTTEFYSNLDKLVGLTKKINPDEAEEVFVQYRSGMLNNRSLFNELIDVSRTSLENYGLLQ